VTNINTCAVSASTRFERLDTVKNAAASVGTNETFIPTVQGGATSHFSALANRLSVAASHAEARDKETNHKVLGDKAIAIVNQLFDDSYSSNKTKYDNEIPNTDDPQSLASAKKATDFIHHRASNPFKGMSRDQLALIAYDESGTFTINERRAAWIESHDQEEAWRQVVVQKATDEYNRTGKMTKFFTEVLAHYKELPRIERSQYPEDYASKLQEWIDLDINYKTNQAEGKGKKKNPDSLIDEIFQKLQPHHAAIKLHAVKKPHPCDF